MKTPKLLKLDGSVATPKELEAALAVANTVVYGECNEGTCVDLMFPMLEDELEEAYINSLNEDDEDAPTSKEDQAVIDGVLKKMALAIDEIFHEMRNKVLIATDVILPCMSHADMGYLEETETGDMMDILYQKIEKYADGDLDDKSTT